MKKINLDRGRILAKEIAEKIISQEITEFDGAMQIWKEIIDHLEKKCPDDLWPFKSNASAIEDCIWNCEQGGANNNELVQQCKEEITDAAKKLINKCSTVTVQP